MWALGRKNTSQTREELPASAQGRPAPGSYPNIHATISRWADGPSPPEAGNFEGQSPGAWTTDGTVLQWAPELPAGTRARTSTSPTTSADPAVAVNGDEAPELADPRARRP